MSCVWADTRTQYAIAVSSPVERLRERIAREGPLTFAEFMRAALYDPDGYYATHAPMGFGGDYLTAPETTPLFGATLSRLASATWRALARPETFDVIDVGAGSGALLRDLSGALREEDPEAASAARLVAIEVSGAADRAQARALGGLPVQRARSLGALGPIEGLVVANELLDALPFHLVTQRDNEVRELRVAIEGERFAFSEAAPSDERLVAEAPPLEAGERAAVPLAAYEWLAALAKAIERGIALVIDYPSRERSDVRTYFRHTSGGDALDRVGEQDLTAALDFVRLRRRAEDAGLEVLDDLTQAEFLENLGFEDRLREIEGGVPADPIQQLKSASARNAARTIVDPGGMGAFSVLVLAKGLRL